MAMRSWGRTKSGDMVILGWDPLELCQTGNRRRDAEEASDDRSGEEPGLPCCVTKNGTDDGAQARTHREHVASSCQSAALPVPC